LPKSKIQNSKFKKKKVLLKVSDRQKWGGEKGKIFQTHIFDFHCAAKNIEGWLKISTSFSIYSQIWLNLHRDDYHFFYIFLWMINILATNKKNKNLNTSALCLGHTLQGWPLTQIMLIMIITIIMHYFEGICKLEICKLRYDKVWLDFIRWEYDL
jgi:hypothetical protein